MDRISRLPDDVICHILSFLPTKHAVATSVLSSRWVKLWSFVPVIDLDDSLYLNPSKSIFKDSGDPFCLNPPRRVSDPMLFIKFLERISYLNKSHTIAKFRLYMSNTYPLGLSDINVFIENVFWRNVVEIDFKILSAFSNDEDDWIQIPPSESLRVLKVATHNSLTLPAFPGCFPSLRVFDVNASVHHDDVWITDLFPCLPALEKLRLFGEFAVSGDFHFNIGGDALKHLDLQLYTCDYEEFDAVVVIDAPKLEYLRLQDTILASYLVKHKPAINEVKLHVGESQLFYEIMYEVIPTRLSRFNDLLQGLINTNFISVCAITLEVIFSERWNIPVLPYLTKLELEVPATSWILLLHWLEKCPNLKVLSLIMKEENHGEESEEEEWMVPDVVPSCLSSCVKEIEIKRLGKADEEEMLKYLLDNAKVLDKFEVESCM